MRRYQDSYAAAVAHLGIDRGEPGSTAKHSDIKEYYQAVNSSTPPTEKELADWLEPDKLKELWRKSLDYDRLKKKHGELENELGAFKRFFRKLSKLSDSEKLAALASMGKKPMEVEHAANPL